MTAVLFTSFAILLVLNVPIAFSLFISSSIAIIYGGIPITAVIQRGVTATDSFILLAIPFFMVAGNLMDRGGISRRIISYATESVGFIRGGLAHVNIVTSMIFAGITGSAVADTSAVGSILIPAMVKEGYKKDFSVAVTASSSVIGVIIPPSIPFVIYGVITGASIGKLFLGGLIPGILIGLSQMLVSYVIVKKDGVVDKKKFNLRNLLREFGQSFFALMTPVIILGGITLGIVTPTEAAVLAIVYALLVSFLFYKELRIKEIPKLLLDSATTTAIVMFMVAGAFLYGWIITNDMFPQKVARVIMSVSQNPTVILLLFVVLFLVCGMFMDLGAGIVLLIPVLYPVSQTLGIDPVLLGVVTVISLAIGLVTPPVGACLFIACQIGDIELMKGAKACIPFILGTLAIVLLIVFFPQIALYVPSLMK